MDIAAAGSAFLTAAEADTSAGARSHDAQICDKTMTTLTPTMRGFTVLDA
jgi:hypothetical protein